jgi:hypothetical protein
MKEISDEQLIDFCRWFRQTNGKTHTYVSTLGIIMAGRFHITARMAEPLVKRCRQLGLIHIKNHHDVYFLDTDEPDFRPFDQEW